MASALRRSPCADREGDYFFLEGAFLSPEASSLLITDPGGNVKIFDAAHAGGTDRAGPSGRA